MEPPGKNAVDLTLAAWELAPATPDSKRLVDDVLKSLSEQEAQAIGRGNDARAILCQQKADLLANATIGQSAPAWRTLNAAASAALLNRARKASSVSDNAGLAQTQALAKQLNLSQAIASIPTGQPASPPPVAAPDQSGHVAPNTNPPQGSSAGTVADVEPGFIKLHGPILGFPAAAVANAEVTLHEYDAFVKATHRAASDCSIQTVDRPANEPARSAQNSARFGQGFRRNRPTQSTGVAADAPANNKAWNHPGYPQQGNHPVVCVSWDDANAYTQWLSQRNGHLYRLPSVSEWRMATAAGVGSLSADRGTVAALSGSPNKLGLYGLDGNVSEWLLDCALGCERRQVAGRSWRNRGTDEVPSGRKKERAFDDVGFRVVEVLGTRK